MNEHKSSPDYKISLALIKLDNDFNALSKTTASIPHAEFVFNARGFLKLTQESGSELETGKTNIVRMTEVLKERIYLVEQTARYEESAIRFGEIQDSQKMRDLAKQMMNDLKDYKF